jgi:hypothetical protein
MVDTEVLRHEIRHMERHSTLFKVLKEELTALGYWRNQKRGNPRAGYEAQCNSKQP